LLFGTIFLVLSFFLPCVLGLPASFLLWPNSTHKHVVVLLLLLMFVNRRRHGAVIPITILS
jgi:hypothetical protein